MTIRLLPNLTAATLAAALARCASAEPVRLELALDEPVRLARDRHTAYLKIGVTGGRRVGRRAPVNVALVIDRSGSMSGRKIERAKEAALRAIDRLGPDDVVSVVAYETTVRVLQPATKLTDRAVVERAIRRLEAGGSTALFAGVARGAAEVRKFLDRRRVNRVVLLSDGLANVGPSSPSDLGRLGASLLEEGISVTTIGLGLDYNEDLMTALARASDGNHAFVEHADDLGRIFDLEFGDVLSVVARDVVLRIRLGDGVRAVRALGRGAEIAGSTVTASLAQVYANQEKVVLLEVEVPPGVAGGRLEIASVGVEYADLATGRTERLDGGVAAEFTDFADVVERRRNHAVRAAVVEQIAAVNNEMAVNLRDAGRIDEARRALRDNADYIEREEKRSPSPRLRRQRDLNLEDSENLDPHRWTQRRKAMRKEQYNAEMQQAW